MLVGYSPCSAGYYLLACFLTSSFILSLLLSSSKQGKKERNLLSSESFNSCFLISFGHLGLLCFSTVAKAIWTSSSCFPISPVIYLCLAVGYPRGICSGICTLCLEIEVKGVSVILTVRNISGVYVCFRSACDVVRYLLLSLFFDPETRHAPLALYCVLTRAFTLSVQQTIYPAFHHDHD